MTFVQFLASILAVYCVSLTVSKLAGPGGIFTKLRRSAKGSVKEGLSCPICFGVWVAALLCGYQWAFLDLPAVQLPLWTFAVAGGSALIHILDPV